MDISPTFAFRGLVAGLLLTSVYFTIDVELRRATSGGSASGLELTSGDTVTLVEAIDGDEVGATIGDRRFVVRLVGIKAFDDVNQPGMADLGSRARARLKRYVGQPVQLELGDDGLKTDRVGRVLGYLRSDGTDGIDIGEAMVRDGLVMVYTKHPFDRSESYLSVEEQARHAERGLWGSPMAVERADTLRETWAAE